MSQYITVNEYAALHHKQPVSVRKLAQRGSLKSAKKIGGVWLIDKEEQYPDHRRSGSVKSFEMVRGMYLVDEIAYVEGLPSTYVRIGDQWCKKDVFRRQLDKTNPEPTPVPYDPFAGEDSERKMNAGWFEAAQNFGCLPRDTDFVRKELKRAATRTSLPLSRRSSMRSRKASVRTCSAGSMGPNTSTRFVKRCLSCLMGLTRCPSSMSFVGWVSKQIITLRELSPCVSDNRITKICYDIVMGTAEKLEATDIRPGRPRLGGYDEATAIINFKVPASWKTAMAQEAKSRNQNLSDYLREVTSLGYSAMHAGE